MMHDTMFLSKSQRAGRFHAAQISIFNLFSTHPMRVPHYQRLYQWTKDQIDNLMADIAALYSSEVTGVGVTGTTHFLTTVMLHRRMAKGQTFYDVVDGQQRLTTLFLFLAAVRGQTLLQTDNDRAAAKVRADIDQLLYSEETLLRCQNTDDTHSLEPRFQHSLLSDRLAFTALCRHDVQTAALHNKTMAKAYQLLQNFVRSFYEAETDKKLRNSQAPSAAFLNNMFALGTCGLDVMTMTTDEAACAQRAYIDINSKGLPLPTLDLVRAAFASEIDEQAFNPVWQVVQNHLQNHKADTFLQHWMQARAHASATKGDLHKTFLRLANAPGGIAINLATLDAMAEDAKRYDRHSRGEAADGSVIDGLFWADETGLRQHRPLLLAAGHIERDTPALFEKLCEEIARLALVASAGQIQTNKMSGFWETWTKQIASVRTKSELEVFLDSGIRKVRGDLVADLEQDIARLGETTKWNGGRPERNTRQQTLLAYFAYDLEKRRCNAQGAKAFDARQTLEHIIPVSDIGAYAGELTKEEFRKKAASLGNLTLLTHEENCKAGTMPVARKIPIYAASAIALSQASVHAIPASKNGRTADMLRILPRLVDSFGMADVDNRTASIASAIAALLLQPVG